MVHVSKWRKKPVEIEACQFVYTDHGIKTLREFCGDSLGIITKARHPDAKAQAQIVTLEDGDLNTMQVQHIATEGDYIIKGVQGEFYACKPDIFLQTYEQVKTPSFLDALIRDYTTRTDWLRDSEDFLGVYNTVKHFPVIHESDGQFTGGVYSTTYDAAKFTYECIFEGNDELPFQIIRRPK